MNDVKQNQAAEVVREFGERVRDKRWDDVAVTIRISGGMPSQRRREEFEVQGNGSVRGLFSDAVSARAMREESRTFSQAETDRLLRRAAASVTRLAEQQPVRFPPDALVGSITVNVAGRQATLYFVPEEERPAEPRRLPDDLRENLAELRAAFPGLRREGERR